MISFDFRFRFYFQIFFIFFSFGTFTIAQVYAHHAADCPSGPSNCGAGKDNGSRIIGQSCSLRGGCGAFAGEPVSLRSGNMTVSHTDFVIQTGGMPIYLTRTYNSHTPSFSDFWALPQNELGVGWHHNQQSATGIKFLYNNNGTMQPSYACGNCGGTGPTFASSPWYYSGSALPSYPGLVILYHGTMPYYFHQKSAGTSNYDPMKGLGGYKLDYSSKTVTTPKGTKILFSANHVERRTRPSGAYLLYHYANKNLQNNSSSSSDKLSMIHAYLADGTLLRRGMIFNYKKENFDSPAESQNHDGLISAGIVDTKTLPTCETDSQCYTKGYPYAKCIITPGKSSGYCSTCYKTYASNAVWDQSQLIQTRECSTGETCMYPTSDIAPLIKYSWETSPISNNEWGIFGFCAKKVVEYEYDKHTVRYKRSDGEFGSMELSYLSEVHFPPFSTINSSTPCSSQSNCLSYSYEFVSNDNDKKRVLVSVKDANNKILEAHTYGDGYQGTHEAPIVTLSTLPQGTLNFSYNMGSQGSSETTITKTSTTYPNSSECRTVIVEPHTSRVTRFRWKCGASQTDEHLTWANTGPSNHFYTYPLHFQTPQKSGYTSFYHKFNTDKSKLEHRIITIGDTDTDAQTVPNDNAALQVKTYYHPEYPRLIIGYETKSIISTANKRYMIYDYNQTSRCPANNCSPDAYYQSGDSSAVLYRIIERGWTKNFTGIVEHTRITSFDYYSDGRLKSITYPDGRKVELAYHSDTVSEVEDRYMTSEITIPNCTTGGASCVTKYRKYNKFGAPSEIEDINGVVHKIVYDALGRIIEIHQDIRTSKGQSSCVSGNTSVCAVWKFIYNDGGRLKEITKPSGGSYIYDFDTYGRTTKVWFKSSSTSTPDALFEYVYDQGTGKVIEIKRLQALDNQSQIISTKIERAFSASGNLTGGRIVKILSGLPNQGQKEFHFNQDGTLSHHIDEKGQRTEYTYHARRQWLTEITRYIGPGTTNPTTIKFEYDKYGRIVKAADAKQVSASPSNPSSTKYVYDDFGQLISIESPDRAPLGKEIQFVYDSSGRIIKKKRPRDTIANPIQYTYDNMSRLTKIDYPAPLDKTSFPMLTDNDITFTYDENYSNEFTLGRLTSVSVNIFDVSGNNTQIMKRITRYLYDAQGRVKRVNLEEYDGVNTTPITHYMEYSYDIDGNLIKSKYPFGPWGATYGFDTRGQLKHVGRLGNVGNGQVGVIGYLLSSQYNLPSGMSSPGGMLNSLYYHRQPQAIPLAQQITGNESWVKFRKNNKVATVPQSGGLSQSFHAGGSELNDNLQGHAGLFYRVYEYDHNGLIRAIKCTSGSDSNCYQGNQNKIYTYDGLNRLITGGHDIGGYGKYTYNYDKNGNLIQKLDNSSGGLHYIMEYAPDSNRLQKRYHTTQNPPLSGPNYHQYDDGKRKEDPNWNYYYHSNGRLAVMEPKPGNTYGRTLLFGYDHNGLRIIKYVFSPIQNPTNPSVADEAHLYYYDIAGRMVEEIHYPYLALQSQNYKHRIWFWAGRIPFAAMDIDTDDNGDLIFADYNYFFDHLGRPIVAVNTSEPQGGGPTWRSLAQPYGKENSLSLASSLTDKTDLIDSSVIPNPLPIQKLPYGSNENHSQTIEMIKPGTYGVQFYFEKLNLESGYDYLTIDKVEPPPPLGHPSFSPQIHIFTGNHHTGKDNNPTGGFWGPVIPLRHKDVGLNGTLGKLRFNLTSDGGIEWDGYKITSYRLWRITDGKQGTFVKNDVLPTNGNGYYSPGTDPTGSLVWSKTYTQPGAKLIRVIFSSFETENRYDWVEIRDAQDHIIQVITGNRGALSSAWVEGQTVKVYFYADQSVEKPGFTIDSVEAKYSMEVKHRFPGQWYDKDTEIRDIEGNLVYAGLHYNWYRYYDSEVGRYITPDPIGLSGGMNLYLYADANPVNFVDVFGLSVWVLPRPSGLNSYEVGMIVGGTALATLLLQIMASNSGGGPSITPTIDGDRDEENDCPRYYPGLPFVGGADKVGRGLVNGAKSVWKMTRSGAKTAWDSTKRLWRKLFDECFVAGTLVSTPKGKKKIEDIQVGDFVHSIHQNKVHDKTSQTRGSFSSYSINYNKKITQNALKEYFLQKKMHFFRKSIDDEEIIPATWRKLKLTLKKKDGSLAKIELLRPLWWIKQTNARNGRLWLSMPEMGLKGWAKVHSIGPCKVDSRKRPPDSQTAIGKFVHENAPVYDLYFDGMKKPLGVTPNHPIFSLDRNQWIPARLLTIGEKCASKERKYIRLRHKIRKRYKYTVYNIEIHKKHTYFVSNGSILVHNSCYHLWRKGMGGALENTGRSIDHGFRHLHLSSSSRNAYLEEGWRLRIADNVPAAQLNEFGAMSNATSSRSFTIAWERYWARWIYNRNTDSTFPRTPPGFNRRRRNLP